MGHKSDEHTLAAREKISRVSSARWLESGTLAFGVGLSAIAACVLVYFPGLSGPFLFDDFGTLAELGDLGGVRDWQTFSAYVFGGNAGPTGRPLALVSFLVDGNNWPAEPWPFKRTNLLIHLLTAGVLAALIWRILLAAKLDEPNARLIAVLSAAMWLLHPFLASTTLYVVQRMAQLSTLFVFSGLLCYVHGRTRLHARRVNGYLFMSAGIGVFGLLAALSKENGVLLPILVAVLELTVFSSHRAQGEPPHKLWTITFVILPSCAVLLYLANYAAGDRWHTPNPTRGISVYERLLTESRILADYLYHWFVPRLQTPGIFQDYHVPSSNLLTPITTVFAVLGHLAAIALALVWRRRYSLFACAVLFFYAAHLLESTVINLELYFEHRNYLASCLLFVPPLVFLRLNASSGAFAAVTACILFTLAVFTNSIAKSWSSYESMVTTAALIAPTSERAQQQYSQLLFNSGQFVEANRVVDEAIQRLPGRESLHLHKMIISCRQKTDSETSIAGLRQALEGKLFDVRLFAYYENLLMLASNGECQTLTLDNLRQMLTALLTVPRNRDPAFVGNHQLTYLLGQTELQLGRTERAANRFRQSFSSRPTASRAMLMAAVMASAEQYYEAKVFSDIAAAVLRRGDAASPITPSEIDNFQMQLRREVLSRAQIED